MASSGWATPSRHRRGKVEDAGQTAVPLFDAYSQDPIVSGDGTQLTLPLNELEEIEADRRLRQRLKPFIDNLRNRRNLASSDVTARRSAATDLGYLGNPEAIGWLEEALVNEPDRWVRHTMATSIQLLRMAQDDPHVRLAAVETLGELRAARALPALQELLQAEAGAAHPDPTLRAAVTAAVKRIEAWGTLTVEHPSHRREARREWLVMGLLAILLLVVIPLLNTYPDQDSGWWVSDYSLNLFGKFLAYAILALGLDLIWGYTGILSLGHGVFFGLGAYCMGMHLMLAIGDAVVYQSMLPDFMMWNQVRELPLFWKPFDSLAFSVMAVILTPVLLAAIFGFLAFRSRIRGVYFAIITQALALSVWLLFNRNETNLGGTNGLTDFKTILGFQLRDPGTQRAL